MSALRVLQGLDAGEARAFAEIWLPACNPAWVWTHRGSVPLADGFLNEWHASIPAGSTTVEVDGVCTVQMRDGRIYRNQVYFDPSTLLAALAGAKG